MSTNIGRDARAAYLEKERKKEFYFSLCLRTLRSEVKKRGFTISKLNKSELVSSKLIYSTCLIPCCQVQLLVDDDYRLIRCPANIVVSKSEEGYLANSTLTRRPLLSRVCWSLLETRSKLCGPKQLMQNSSSNSSSTTMSQSASTSQLLE